MPIIIGADEVGYGALAGPVVVCGVRAATGWSIAGLNDSKKLSEKKRLLMTSKLKEHIYNGIIMAHIAERSCTEIDKVGIAVALKSAYAECFKILDYYFDDDATIIVDGNLKFDNSILDEHHIRCVVKADTKIPTVMAASILAKTYRDEKMKAHHLIYPQYNWIKNVGYGSADHLKAIINHGPSPLHRYSYAPMKDMLI